LATQPPLAPDPTISTSYGMVCTEPTPGVDSEETLSLCLLKSLFLLSTSMFGQPWRN